MSVPPLVCSTPPPPDQVEEEGYNDEFTFNYDLSPTHQYDTYGLPSPRDKLDDNLYISTTDTDITFDHQTIIKTSISLEPVPPEKLESEPVENIPNDDEVPAFTEECNIEDLDLKLDSMHLDFENERVTVEDSLNSTFDDFGTFLSNSDFVSKIDAFSESDKESKSHGTCSEESTSLHNEDWDNISQNSLNTTSNISPEQEDCKYIKKDNNDNIPKDVFILSSPHHIDVGAKEESIDSGFKSSTNNSTEQIHNIVKTEQCDTKSDIDVSVTEANTLSISEFNELDKDKNNKDEDIVVTVEDIDLHEDGETDFNEFTGFSDGNVDFVANFDEDENNVHSSTKENDGFGDFTDSNSLFPSEDNLDIKFNDTSPQKDEESSFDDFGNFADFKTGPKSIEINEPALEGDIDDFAEFKSQSITETKQECEDVELQSSSKPQQDIDGEHPGNDDDFGDFDTYDPSAVQPTISEDIDIDSSDNKSYKVNDLVFSSDTEILDILKRAVAGIYHEEGTDEGADGEHDLLSVLGGSWRHLKEYETKQSYLFPWSTSTSHKSLLKSLGIDSRNILFGPKWNANVPRFAANLGASPLQPIKPTSQTYDGQYNPKGTSSCEDVEPFAQQNVPEWQGGDGFSMDDGQASSYAESLLLDLEHLMATLDQMTSGQSPHFKISDLFSNACNERNEEHVAKTQILESGSKYEKHPPTSILNIGRKINLPDTHIFTPTDSETPWSHTIHYEDTSNDFVQTIPPCKINDDFIHNTEIKQPQTLPVVDDFDDFQSAHQYTKQETIQSQEQLQAERPSEEETTPNLTSEDDFGDFHSATAMESVVHQPEVIQPVNVLLPVKVTPAVTAPVVNWPEPGDIDTSVFEQLSDMPTLQPSLPSWVENKEQPSWVSENKEQTNTNLFVPPTQVTNKIFPTPLTSFILKETKIDTVVTEDTSDPHIKSYLTNNINSMSSAEFDDFTDFQSVSPIPQSTTHHIPQPSTSSVHTTYNMSNNTAESVFSNTISNDFQPMQFNSLQPNYDQSNTTSFINTPSQMPNYFLPSTLGESFLKPDNAGTAFTPFHRNEEPATKNNSQQQQILQPLSLENYSQINWPNPGIDIQDLSRFNPVNSIHSYSEPKETKVSNTYMNDDDGWSDFVSIKSVNPQSQSHATNQNKFAQSQQNEEDDWSDFVSGTVLPSRSTSEVKTISQNIHAQTSSNSATGMFPRNASQNPANAQFPTISNHLSALPHLSYASSKFNSKGNFQNL